MNWNGRTRQSIPFGMISAQRSPLERIPEARTLLTAYSAGQATATDGWLDRFHEVRGVETGELSRLHGKLIALGLLDFQLSDRTGGMRYQVTPAGFQALREDQGQPLETDEPETKGADAA